MLKLLTFLLILGFAWWRLRRVLSVWRLRRQGVHVPEQKGPRPVTLFAAVLLGAYAGFLLWELFGASSGN